MSEKKYVSSSPHFTLPLNTQMIMATVLIALIPECVMGIILFKWAAASRILVSLASCVFFEFIFQKITRQKVTISNLSACVTGLLLALSCSSTVPLWMFVVGSAVAIIVAKGLFGGIGSNVFNPALTGRAFMFLSFPAAMGASWLVPSGAERGLAEAVEAIGTVGVVESVGAVGTVDAITSATTLSAIKAGTFAVQNGTYWKYFIGNHSGCIGETSALLILISFTFLVLTRVIDPRASIAMIGTLSLCTLASGGNLLMALMTGGLLFGATFMVTDYATAPVTKKGRIIFGFGCGLITFLIRKFGGYPEGVMFSILIMNSIAPFLNNLTARKYGYKNIKKRGVKNEQK